MTPVELAFKSASEAEQGGVAVENAAPNNKRRKRLSLALSAFAVSLQATVSYGRERDSVLPYN
jgi:hypothetical protein